MSDRALKHRNSTHGVTRAELQLRHGEPFDGLALDLYHANLGRWGYSDGDLVGMGTLGSIIERTAKLNSVADLLWGGLLGAAALGHVEAFYTLEKNYGHRVNQALQALYKLLELMESERQIVNYDDAVNAARAASGDDDPR